MQYLLELFFFFNKLSSRTEESFFGSLTTYIFAWPSVIGNETNEALTYKRAQHFIIIRIYIVKCVWINSDDRD